ncbi:unnamed protein product [Mytilus coruscus]|uniref:Mutator-like transposase domain-containing protein n=1 Tax=Mytilus coruscus TaxID=42192 RepID=A0A6J8CH62_MYTCO|nr:unnamed protein product [Mytilus coruscus]
MVKSIGVEYTWAKECILDLKADNNEVEYLVTDPDSSAYRATQDLYEEGTTSTQPEHFLDTRHVSENIRKRTKNDKNLLQIMPARIQVKRQKLLNCFSVDLTERCNAELAQAMKIYSENFQKIKCKISHVVDAIFNCYTGNHLSCKKQSFLCDELKKVWLRGRSLVPKTFKIAHSQQNIDFIRKTVNLRLGPNMLENTRLNMNTSFVEGFNRSLRRSLPSNVTFNRNITGRAHSAAHSANFGLGESVLELCTALHCEVSVGGSAYKALNGLYYEVQ